jgi:hypothetical protein
VLKARYIADLPTLSGYALPTVRFGKAEQKIESKNEK